MWCQQSAGHRLARVLSLQLWRPTHKPNLTFLNKRQLHIVSSLDLHCCTVSQTVPRSRLTTRSLLGSSLSLALFVFLGDGWINKVSLDDTWCATTALSDTAQYCQTRIGGDVCAGNLRRCFSDEWVCGVTGNVGHISRSASLRLSQSVLQTTAVSLPDTVPLCL